ncbi:MAG: acyl-CoA desaturase [Candidatus Sumerlaeia bacterium]|nr:acyl-CoA desaturase [Candidatus Sumerlaeia bacterium]
MSESKSPIPKPAPYTWREGLLDLKASVPFLAVHAGCLLLIPAGFSWQALLVCLLLYYVRMFGITAGFHRYFSHRSFRTSRGFQFALALLGTTAAQRGPLWWAAHHRYHHRHSDSEHDIHSPGLHGLIWSHIGWIFSRHSAGWDRNEVRDWLVHRELDWLTRWHMVVPFFFAWALYGFGLALESWLPAAGITGLQMLAWGFFASTVLLYHGTFTINSLAHLIGSRRFDTRDDSRNNLFLSILTLGEGWHNNHHRYPASERQGFYWWEIDPTHWVLKALSWFGLVWDLKAPPQHILEEGRQHQAA